jgi:hypothetical protein
MSSRDFRFFLCAFLALQGFAIVGWTAALFWWLW